jgi:serine/threonine protein kinase
VKTNPKTLLTIIVIFKGRNVLIKETGDVVIADFGVSKILQDSTATGGTAQTNRSITEIVGSPLWMSPEAVEGKPTDFKTDIWYD